MEFDIYVADCVGKENNAVYPQHRKVDNAEALQAAVQFDHVCAEYKAGHRSKANFIQSNVLVMDCDNEQSEAQEDWVTPESFVDMLPDVAMAIVPSRNNMKRKGNYAARPRFHVYFPIDEMTEADEYSDLKGKVKQRFLFFDEGALDSARFIYGCKAEGIVWHEGCRAIAEALQKPVSTAIPQGQRNTTMSRFAGRIIVRFGANEKTYQLFLDHAERCDPPLEDEELNKIWRSAVRFGAKVAKQKGYVPPEQYNKDFGRAESLCPEDFSDIGQAKVLAREYRDELKYTPATDYLRYDGVTWNESRAQAIGAMEEFLDLQMADANDAVAAAYEALKDSGVSEQALHSGGKVLEKEIKETQGKAYAAYIAALAYQKFVQKRRDMKYVLSALQAARPMLEIEVDDLDHDAFLLNTPDGAYDLRLGLSGKRGHAPSDYATKVTAVEPGTKGEQIWRDAIGTFFCGDIELMDYVQQIVGLAAVGKVYVESLIIAYGEGRNGKSTFWNTVARVLGTYSGNISADTLTVGCKRNVKPELAEAKGKRMLIAAELDEGMRLNTSLIKQLCSTDSIQAEKKYKDPFHFMPSHTLVLYTNHLPRVGANDPGTWRRLLVIPFDAVIEGSNDIKNYADYLFEEAGPAVLSWVIEGAQKVIEHGFHLSRPSCVESAIASYRDNNDWLGHFLEDCCVIDTQCHEKSGELYSAYRAYATSAGEYVRSTTDFYTAIEQRGFIRHRTNKGVTVYGLKLIEGREFLG